MGNNVAGQIGAVAGGGIGVLNAFKNMPKGGWGASFDKAGLESQIGLGIQAATSFFGVMQSMQGVMKGDPMSIVMGALSGFGLYSSLMMMGVNPTMIGVIIAVAVIAGIVTAILGSKKVDRAMSQDEQALTRAVDEITYVGSSGPVMMLAGVATLGLVLYGNPDTTSLSQSIATPVSYTNVSIDRQALNAAIKRDGGHSLNLNGRTTLVSAGTGANGADQVMIVSPDAHKPSNMAVELYTLKKNMKFVSEPYTGNPTNYRTLLNADGTINENTVEEFKKGLALAGVGADPNVPTDLAYRATRQSATTLHPVK